MEDEGGEVKLRLILLHKGGKQCKPQISTFCSVSIGAEFVSMGSDDTVCIADN